MPDPFTDMLVQQLQMSAAAGLSAARAKDAAFQQQLAAHVEHGARVRQNGLKQGYFSGGPVGPMQNPVREGGITRTPTETDAAVDRMMAPGQNAARRLYEGQNPFGPDTPTNPADLVQTLGDASWRKDLLQANDETAAIDSYKAKALAANPHLDVQPKDVVQERDIGGYLGGAHSDPAESVIPTPPRPLGHFDTSSTAQTPEQLKAQADVHALVQKHGIGPLFGALVDGKQDPYQAVQTLGQLLDTERRAKLGDMDPSNMVYGL